MTIAQGPVLTDRQSREIEYHRGHASKVQGRPLMLDLIEPGPRKWWIGIWDAYRDLQAIGLDGKAVLVPGCGLGDDAIRIAKLGGKVSAFDLSRELIEQAERRAGEHGVKVAIAICPAEALPYPDASFDLVVFNDILHHVDIPQAMAEVRRVLKPGGMIVGCEIYTHSWAQRIRESWLVREALYRRMVGFIYGPGKPYITEDEHKIDEAEFAQVMEGFTDLKCRYFNIAAGRIFPTSWAWCGRADRLLAMGLGSAGRFLAGRVVFSATKGAREEAYLSTARLAAFVLGSLILGYLSVMYVGF